MAHFADRLVDAIAAKRTPAVVALDPVYDHLPPSLRANTASDAGQLSAIGQFSADVIRIIAPLVPVVKINSAYFECYHGEGVRLYDDLIQLARRHGLMVIGDVKRGDVGHTAEMYARAHMPGPDAITVSGYFGLDGVKPFIDDAVEQGKGLFVLVRTSNTSAPAIQDLALADGRKLHEAVAGEVAGWAADPRTIGRRGWSVIGAVAATRNAADAAAIRKALPHSVLLVPGYGAQGGKAEDYRPYFRKDGTGAIIAAGRSVIFAFERPEYRGVARWQDAVKAACDQFARDVSGLGGAD